jgi:putative MATE family efflux protein
MDDRKVRTTSRTIWSISYPIIIAGLSEKIIELTDVVFLARYGVVELGAIALAAAIYETSIFLIAGLVDGIQIIVARRAGQGKDLEVGNVFNHGLYLLTVVSVALILAIKFISPYITTAIIGSPGIAKAVDDFLQIFAFAILFHAANMTYSAFYVGVSRTKILIGATSVLAVVNIVLDYCLIFGNLGFPRLGIRGAAIASLTAEICAFLVLTVYAWLHLDIKRYGLLKLKKWNKSLSKLLMDISFPASLDALVETIRWLLFFLIIERLGETPLAMANIIYSCYALFLIPIEGFSETLCSMVSNLIGQGESSKIWGLLHKTMLLSAVVILPFLVISFVEPGYVLSIFTSDADILKGCVNSLRIIVMSVMFMIAGEMFISAVAGTGDTVATFLIEIILTIFVLIWTYSAALQFGLRLEYVWLSEAIGWSVCLSLSFIWLRKGYWRRLHI